MKKVLFVSGIGGDTRRYRCLHHQEQLALQGIASSLREATDTQLYIDILQHDMLILHRVAYSDMIADLISIARLRGLPVIFETDDLVFEPTLAKQIAYIDSLSPEEAMRFRENLFAQAQCFSRCDYVLTTNRYLANAAEKQGKKVYIQRNAFSAEMIRCAEKVFSQSQQLPVTELNANLHETSVTLGYFSGTNSHNRDFDSIAEALLILFRQYPNLYLHIGGYLELSPQFLPFKERILRTPFVSWQELPGIIAQVDINLAPLEMDNPFCHAKSEIKYSEAALVGVPTIASATDAFAYAITPGENGLLATTTDEWVSGLQQLIDHPDQRRLMAALARRRVLQEYIPQERSQQLYATLTEIESNQPKVDSDPTALALLVATGMRRELDVLVKLQRQQEEEIAQHKQILAKQAEIHRPSTEQFWRQNYETAQRQYVDGLTEILERLQKRQAQS